VDRSRRKAPRPATKRRRPARESKAGGPRRFVGAEQARIVGLPRRRDVD
jgi:hypothetical protein